jgi:hypothetical protein
MTAIDARDLETVHGGQYKIPTPQQKAEFKACVTDAKAKANEFSWWRPSTWKSQSTRDKEFVAGAQGCFRDFLGKVRNNPPTYDA